MSTEYFDSHCHFDFNAFDTDRDDVWHSAKALGTRQLVIPGVSPEQWPRAAATSRQYIGIFHAAGVHPWWLKDLADRAPLNGNRMERLRNLLTDTLQEPGCVAVGECGLDLAIDTPLEAQETMLALHLEVAQATSMPVIIHNVRAHNPLLRLLKTHTPSRGGVIHAFSGSLEMAKEYWSLGFYLGVGGIITYERAQKTWEALRKMPLKALLLETDAPDMPLCGHQGERNTPERIPEVAQALARLREESIDVIAGVTTDNSRRLFGLE